MKKISIIAALALALSLTACTTATENPSENLSDNLSSALPENSSDNSENPPGDSENNDKEPLPFTLFGADGVRISFADVSSITAKDGSTIAPDALEDPNWSKIICEDFAYLAEHGTVYFNSIDNAELFDSENIAFSDAPEYSDIEYKRYNVGDKVGSLTLKSAKTTFSRDGLPPLPIEELKEQGMPLSMMFRGCEASFEGELTMTGYVRVCVDEYGVQAGDILFVPSKDCPLPVANYSLDKEGNLLSENWLGYAGGFAYQTSYPKILLGNINDNAVMREFPTDGTSVKTKITVDNISMFNNMYVSYIEAEITAAEML